MINRSSAPIDDLVRRIRGKRITVMGLGFFGGGLGAARFLESLGARITVTDLRQENELANPLESLGKSNHRLVLGRHEPEDFTEVDMIVASPAVPYESKWLEMGRRRGIPIETEISLFMRLCRGRVIGVTGSNGKTTTAHLLAAALKRSGRPSFLGGNMGISLLDRLDEIEKNASVVLELSSFQLESLGPLGLGPTGAVVVNLTPNHLDRHGTMECYESAKKQILLRAEWAVLPKFDPRLSHWSLPNGKIAYFGEGAHPPCATEFDGFLQIDHGKGPSRLVNVADIELKGHMNRLNVMAASLAASLEGVDEESIADAVRSFRPIAHRLESVGSINGIEYFNDSVSTTPESTIAALDAFRDLRPVFLVGGYDKGCEVDCLVANIAQNAAGVVFFGAVADKLEACFRLHRSSAWCRKAKGLEEAFSKVFEVGSGFGAVVLSPAFPSYDQFRNFEERGERFRSLVKDRDGQVGSEAER